MDIYIVIGKLNGYNYSCPDYVQESFDEEQYALNHAVEMAKGDVITGHGEQKYKLLKILRLNTNNKKVTEMELVLTEGQFELKEKTRN